jgi:hypothetical protein
MRLALHIALAAGMVYWHETTKVDPLICFAVYVFGVLVIDGRRRFFV